MLPGLKRIECPCDQRNSGAEGEIPLSEFQPDPYPGVLVFRQHRQHVRIIVGLEVRIECRQGMGKSHQPAVAVERSQREAAAATRDDK